MCGRFVLVTSPDDFSVRFLPRVTAAELEAMLDAGEIAQVLNNYKVRPTQRMPVISNYDGTRKLELARWGLVPFWWKPDPVRSKYPPLTFNARDDKLSSGMWRGPLTRSRCLIPATGFYEWPNKGEGRPPVYVHRRDGGLFAFAGLADTWTDPETGEALRSCSIVTTAPNSFIQLVHDRMPAVLTGPEAETLWLDPATTKLEGVAQVVRPYQWEGMERHGVRPLTNASTGPEVIAPAPEQPALA
jgi:putative SOS response-associated peptidase YedK